MLETAPQSPELTRAGVDALDHWIAIIAPVFEEVTSSKAEAKTRAQNLIATIEGALLLARIRQSSRPIIDVAASYR